MNSELAAWLKKGRANKKDNRKWLKNLSKRPPKKIDLLFHQAHETIFEQTDCLACANCCKTTSPIFRNKDIDRLAKHLKIKPIDLIERYLYVDADGDYVLQKAPCPFLEADNTCRVYEWRPNACREYPHTNRKNMYQLLDLTYRNTLVCPAVARIVDKLQD